MKTTGVTIKRNGKARLGINEIRIFPERERLMSKGDLINGAPQTTHQSWRHVMYIIHGFILLVVIAMF